MPYVKSRRGGRRVTTGEENQGNQSSGNRYGNKYSGNEILMFSDIEEKVGIGDNDRDALNLMLSNYDTYRRTNPEAIAGRSVLRSWNDDIVSELESQGVSVDRTNFATEDYDLKRQGGKIDETLGDIKVYTGMYNDVQSTSGIDNVAMVRTTGVQSIYYQSGTATVNKNLETGTFTTVDNRTFTDLASAMAHAKNIRLI